MPGIDGLELCQIVRKLDDFRTIPVIMLTARDGFFDRIKGKLSGATVYMTKPIDEVKLNQEVERLLAQRTPHPAQRPASPSTAKSMASPLEEIPPDLSAS